MLADAIRMRTMHSRMERFTRTYEQVKSLIAEDTRYGHQSYSFVVHGELVIDSETLGKLITDKCTVRCGARLNGNGSKKYFLIESLTW